MRAGVKRKMIRRVTRRRMIRLVGLFIFDSFRMQDDAVRA